VALHGDYLPDDYLASRLELAPAAEGQTGHLTVARLLAEADFEGVDLAVLGACLSGAGQTRSSALDVAGGIDSALLAAGVRNVISALWTIDDFGALLFHTKLYLELAAGAPLRDAYRGAVEFLRFGEWQRARENDVGRFLTGLDVDLDKAFAALDDPHPEWRGRSLYIDFADPVEWAPYRLCGLGRLDCEAPSTQTPV
jgi:CHAT domain-containing protein